MCDRILPSRRLQIMPCVAILFWNWKFDRKIHIRSLESAQTTERALLRSPTWWYHRHLRVASSVRRSFCASVNLLRKFFFLWANRIRNAYMYALLEDKVEYFVINKATTNEPHLQDTNTCLASSPHIYYYYHHQHKWKKKTFRATVAKIERRSVGSVVYSAYLPATQAYLEWVHKEAHEWFYSCLFLSPPPKNYQIKLHSPPTLNF